jgi:hypothetical protein
LRFLRQWPNSDLLLGFIFVSLPFEFFQKRGPHKVGDANKFMPRCALNFEEHGVRYAGLDRSAVGSRKYFTALALSKGVGLRFSGHLAADAVSDLHTMDGRPVCRLLLWVALPPCGFCFCLPNICSFRPRHGRLRVRSLPREVLP